MPSGAVSIGHRVYVESPNRREMGERKLTRSAATSLHIEGDVNRLSEVRGRSGDTKRPQFVTERVSGDFRVNDLVRQEVRHFEIKSLRGLLINIVRWHGSSKKAAVLLHFKPDRTFERINARRLRETLSKHRCGCEHDGKWENTGGFHVCLQVRTLDANRLLLPHFLEQMAAQTVNRGG
jgi:hypothetical protein